MGFLIFFIEPCMLLLRLLSLLILIFWIYPSTAYCSPFCLDLEDILEVLLQKSSLTLTAVALVPVLAMAFSLTVPGIVSDVATITKGAGPWRSVNCPYAGSLNKCVYYFEQSL